LVKTEFSAKTFYVIIMLCMILIFKAGKKMACSHGSHDINKQSYITKLKLNILTLALSHA